MQTCSVLPKSPGSVGDTDDVQEPRVTTEVVLHPVTK